MQMGAFRKRPGYKQENAMGNANALMGLQRMLTENTDKLTNTFAEQGNINTRGKVSDLMGTDSFQGMDPAQAQAAIAQLTGGRDLGQNFMKTLAMSDDNKGDIQSNEMKEAAATTLFGRQMSKQAQGQRNSLALADKRQAGDAALYGSSGILTPDAMAQKQEGVRQYDEALKDKSISEATKSDLRMQRDKLRSELTYGSAKKPSNYMVEDLLGVKKSTGTRTLSKSPKWGGKIFNKTDPKVRAFITSKYGNQVTEGKDGYYFRGQKLTPEYLKTLGG